MTRKERRIGVAIMFTPTACKPVATRADQPIGISKACIIRAIAGALGRKQLVRRPRFFEEARLRLDCKTARQRSAPGHCENRVCPYFSPRPSERLMTSFMISFVPP